MRNEFKSRRDLIIPMLNEIPGISCESPKGAFYAFFKVEAGGLNDVQLAERLLKEAHVALIPGSSFGEAGRGYLRMSYAASQEALEKGIGNIGKFVKDLGPA